MRPVEVEVADVWREGVRVGTISRTRAGSVFEYTEEFYDRHRDQPDGGVAVHLPIQQRRHETHGANLHAYFAGLLPEGLRLRALVASVKTSADDLLSLLLAVGKDTVGDLVVVPQGESPAPDERPRPLRLEEVSFTELFEESLAATGLEPVVPGVQEKVSASMISFPIPGVASGVGHILKLNPPDKPRLVENEHFFMRMAADCGLRVAKVHLVHDREGQAGLLVDRFDRARRAKKVRRIHQEDACQFLNLYPADKYRISIREIAEGIQEAAAAPVPDIANLLRLVAFSYAICNGDLHAKNVSLLADGPRGSLRLSPGYDLLSTLPYGDSKMALPFEGRDDNLRRAHFVAFGERFGVRPAATEAILDRLCAAASPWLDRLPEVGLSERKTRHLRATMEKRLRDLAG